MHSKSRVVIRANLSSRISLEDIIMTTSTATSDNDVDIMMPHCVHCRALHIERLLRFLFAVSLVFSVEPQACCTSAEIPVCSVCVFSVEPQAYCTPAEILVCSASVFNVEPQACYMPAKIPVCSVSVFCVEPQACCTSAEILVCSVCVFSVEPQTYCTPAEILVCSASMFNVEPQACCMPAEIPFCSVSVFSVEPQACCLPAEIPVCSISVQCKAPSMLHACWLPCLQHIVWAPICMPCMLNAFDACLCCPIYSPMPSPSRSGHFEVTVTLQPSQVVEFNLIYEELLLRKLGLYEHSIRLLPGQVVSDFTVDIDIAEGKQITILKVPPLVSNRTDIVDTSRGQSSFSGFPARKFFLYSDIPPNE